MAKVISDELAYQTLPALMTSRGVTLPNGIGSGGCEKIILRSVVITGSLDAGSLLETAGKLNGFWHRLRR